MSNILTVYKLLCRGPLLFVIVLTMGIPTSFPLSAQGVKLEKTKPTVEDKNRTAAIRKKLRSTFIDLELKEASIKEVVDVFEKKAGISISVDEVALDEIGIGVNDLILTVKLTGVSLNTAFKEIFQDNSMICTLRDNQLTLTSADQAENYTQAVNYDVSKLLKLRRTTSGRVVFKRSMQFDPHQLREMIMTSIEPQSWTIAGGPGTISGLSINRNCFLLNVVNTGEVHEAVGELLAELDDVLKEKSKSKELSDEKDALTTRIYMLDPKTLSPEAAIELVKRLAKEVDWDMKGAEITPVGTTLLINHSLDVHSKVIDILLELDSLKPEPANTTPILPATPRVPIITGPIPVVG